MPYFPEWKSALYYNIFSLGLSFNPSINSKIPCIHSQKLKKIEIPKLQIPKLPIKLLKVPENITVTNHKISCKTPKFPG